MHNHPIKKWIIQTTIKLSIKMSCHPLKIASQNMQLISTNSKNKNLPITGKHSLPLSFLSGAKSQASIFIFSLMYSYLNQTSYGSASVAMSYIYLQHSVATLLPNISQISAEDKTLRISTKNSEKKLDISFSMQFATTMKQDIIQELLEIQMVIQGPNTIQPKRRSSHIQQQNCCIRAILEMKVELLIRLEQQPK